MQRIQSFRIPFEHDKNLHQFVSEYLGVAASEISEIRVLKRSLDARSRRQKFFVYSLEVYFRGENANAALQPFPKLKWNGPAPLIIGAGPAGLFAAWTFLQHGIKPVVFERGDRTHERMRKISRFWRYGELDPESNVCHGEGGAGTFSDGKLITRIKSPHIARVMHALVHYGAPSEIAYVYNPHVGSNLIRAVIRRLCDDLIAQGADFRFRCRVDSLDLFQNQVQGVVLSSGEKIAGTGLILACGHSSGDFFKTLGEQGVHFEPKSFALGLRIEHTQDFINAWQYGNDKSAEDLGAAQYKLQTYWDQEKIGVYTFCMCPGGYVIASSTDPGAVVVNGMSNYHRNSRWANAAVVCSIPQERIPGTDPFKMLTFQRQIEQNAFAISQTQGPTHRIPAQRLDDFLAGREGVLPQAHSCPSGRVAANLKSILPDWIYNHISEGLLEFDKKRKGFAQADAVLHAVESRTSSPVRIPRHPDTFESLSTQGLFPCGEGPGYAGGITSAAVDGIRAALAWIERFAGSA